MSIRSIKKRPAKSTRPKNDTRLTSIKPRISPEEIAKYFAPRSKFRHLVEPVLSQARSILIEKNLPCDPYKTYEGGLDLPSYVKNRGHRENASVAWYAANMLWLARRVQESIAVDKTDLAACWAILFGTTLGEAGMKSQLGLDALRMGKVKKGSKRGGDSRGKQQTAGQEVVWAKWQAEAEKIWKKRPSLGCSAVAKKVHKRYPDSAEDTIRKRIKKPTT